MKVKLTNTRKGAIPSHAKWTYGYMWSPDEMYFWNTHSVVENFNDCRVETYKSCYPYAGAMHPTCFLSFQIKPMRVGVVGIDENGKPFVFYTRHYKASSCPGMWSFDYDEVSDIEIQD